MVPDKQNFHYWAEHSPHELHERWLHCPCVTVWCAVANFGLISPYIFEEGDEIVTVAPGWYVEMLKNFLYPKFDGLDTEHVWFQQDVAIVLTT